MDYKGKLLIAKPILQDSFFSKAVIFITEHEDDKGTVGFVLNKINDKKISELMPDINSEFNTYIGGVVNQDHLFVIHSRPDIIKGGNEITPNLYWSGDYDQIKEAINKQLIKEDEIRFFIGYAGWGEQQLDEEIKQDSWLVYEDQNLNVLEWDENIWKNQLIKINKSNIIWVNSPINPELN